MTSLHLTVGIPASGKTSWARSWVLEDLDLPEDQRKRYRVNRDDTRSYLGLKHGQNEALVSKVQQQTVRNLLQDGFDVVVDDTNLVPKFAKEWLKIAKHFGAEVVWHDEFLKVDVRTCIDRDRNREAQVGADVIIRMAQRARNWKRPTLSEEPDLSAFEPYHGTPEKPKAFLVDIDGTIAMNGEGRDNPNRGWFEWHRVGEDLPIQRVIDIVRHLEAAGLEPVFVSGRDEECFASTRSWIYEYVYGVTVPEAISFSAAHPITLFMRPYRDNRKDSLVKLEIFDKWIRDNFDVQFAIDDRDQVVRAYRDVLGLTVLQCAPGDF
jgi:predicted kinase